jgi:hypothetical protein
MDVKDSDGTGQEKVPGFCEHGNERYGYIADREYTYTAQLSDLTSEEGLWPMELVYITLEDEYGHCKLK